MARKIDLRHLKYSALTYQGASAYDLGATHPLIDLAFTFGSALFTDGFYETQQHEVRRFADALAAAHKVEPRFVWQYAAWMRDPKRGKGNRIQGSLAAALLDSMLDETEYTAQYVAACLGHRPDDVTAFVRHYDQLLPNRPTAAARRGMAQALARFDEYQLMKYAEQKADDVRLCDAIYLVRPQLEALGADGALAIAVGEYLHASSRDRDARAASLPLTQARRALWRQPKSFAHDQAFANTVAKARVTWEQVLSHFGDASDRAANHALWNALLKTRGLLGDMALLRNVRNLHLAGFSNRDLAKQLAKRRFDEVWPHQVYAGFKAVPELEPVFSVAFEKMTAKLPPGRHLGLADASGSMGRRVGGAHGSLTCADVAFCLTALMSETSGLGASFADANFAHYGDGSYLSIAERGPKESALQFASNPEVRRAWGGTQVFGAITELVTWLKRNRRVRAPECLWFFSDMQFHPAEHATNLPPSLQRVAKKHGYGERVPPLELALRLYRQEIGPVDVVLWNLAAYAPAPVAADMEGVLLVSGFDANTFEHVAAWRDGNRRQSRSRERTVEQNQEVVLDQIRSY